MNQDSSLTVAPYHFTLATTQVCIDCYGVTFMELDISEYRLQHTWIMGKTGAGKSTTLINIALGDILNGDGLIFIDPHGGNIDTLLSRIPEERWKDVMVFDPSDFQNPIAFNVLRKIPEEQRPFIASSIVDAFKSAWGYSNMTTPTLDQYLYNTTAALLDSPSGTLMGIKFMLTSEKYRRKVIKTIRDPIVREFWTKEFPEIPDRERRESTRSTLNKIGMLLSDPRIRNIIGQKKNALNLSKAIQQHKIVLIRLPQGKLGVQKAATIGALILSNLHTTALSRTEHTPFHVFIDEVHHFDCSSLIEMLSGIRKFGISLTVCHQYLDQLTHELQSSLLGNTGTKIFFRTGLKDSETLKAEFGENRLVFPLFELQPYVARVTTPDGEGEVKMPGLIGKGSKSAINKILSNSRTKFGSRKSHVDNGISRFMSNT